MMNLTELYSRFLECGTVTTDSRNCPEGSMFIALKGETFNGNAFAEQALAKGCRYAVVDEAEYAGERCILVDDCLKTLQQLANYHRKQLKTPVIGITGTNGKTTTKELVSSVLGKKYNILFTQGNLNNHIGVPMTLLRLTKAHQMAVVEMGANHPGEINTLVHIAEPDYGLITNVGKAHLLGFGSFEGVIKTKGELYDYLREKGNATVFIQNENPYLNGIAHGLNCVRYGQTPGLFISGKLTSCSPFLAFEWTSGQALSEYTPQNNRSQLVDTGHNQLIVDAYNANPTSMTAALENFRQIKASPKMVILGDMRELGEASLIEHQKIIRLLDEYRFERVLLVGPEFAKATSAYEHFNNVDEVKKALEQNKPEGFTILIKGSNSLKLSLLPTSL